MKGIFGRGDQDLEEVHPRVPNGVMPCRGRGSCPSPRLVTLWRLCPQGYATKDFSSAYQYLQGDHFQVYHK